MEFSLLNIGIIGKGYLFKESVTLIFGSFLAFLSVLLNKIPVLLNFLRISFAVDSLILSLFATLVIDYPNYITEVTNVCLFFMKRNLLL